jgi:hypothetical protein
VYVCEKLYAANEETLPYEYACLLGGVIETATYMKSRTFDNFLPKNC